tara:strand:- start:78839 stop:79492 length:654 start_codon:yes stop_codon:yes gene_type:complete
MTLLLDSFVFGAVNSIHCAFMCGPLALAFHGGTKGGATGAAAYHVGRASSYTAIGIALGGLGTVLGSDQLASPTAYVAFVLAAGLIVLATVGERGAIAIPGLNSALKKAMSKSRTWSSTKRAALLGLFTPLLPCGLLWAALAGATVAGSAFDGGTVMTGFALGSLPLLFLAQTQATRLASRFGPNTIRWVQRTAMLTAAGMLIWRGVISLQGESCCH